MVRSLERIAHYCHVVFVRLSVCLGRACIVIIRCTDLSLWLHSPMFWAPWHQSMSTYSKLSFPSSTWVMAKYKLGVIFQERLNKRFRYYWVLIESRIPVCRVDGTTKDQLEWPRVFKINIIRIAHYLCGSWASRFCHVGTSPIRISRL